MAGKTQKKSSKNNKKKQNTAIAERGVIDNIWGIIFVIIGIFLVAAVSFHAAGEFGNMLGDFLKGVFGHVGVILPFYLILFGILLIANVTVHISKLSISMCFVILIMMCMFNAGRFIPENGMVFDVSQFYHDGVTLKGGGFFGMSIGMFLVKYIGKVGLYGISTAIILICLLLVINTPIAKTFSNYKQKKLDKEAEKQAKRAEEIALHQMELETREKERAKYLKEQEKLQKERLRYEKAKYKEELYATPELLFETDKLKIDRNSTDIKPADSNKTKHFVAMMEDDSMFEQREQKGLTFTPKIRGFGIEESREIKEGFGLDGNEEENNSSDRTKSANTEKISDSSVRSSTIKSAPALEDVPKEDYKQTVVSGYKTTQESDLSQNEEKGSSESDFVKISNKEAREAKLELTDFTNTSKVHVYKKPGLSLLKSIKKTADPARANAELEAKAALLENTLQNFRVDAKVVQVTQGPAVTRYEIQPNTGVKVNSIKALSDDIALNLRAKSIRIEAPIPGKAAVGIEVENEKINMVTLREIIDSSEFRQADSKISFAVGRDISGKSIVADLKSMPHLLIAGSTGSGKSVCINSIITSILYKANPDEVKFVLIDPKVVELGNYNGIPHLLIPVVTEPTKAAAALNWAVAEMTDRYKKFAETGVRDLAGYNNYIMANMEGAEAMPQIVIIIDELADLMMAAPSQVEESICRLAQMARAAGMHLIVATQRPSVDIITGVIKANIPSRIAFAVSSQFDSRTILDMAGAEKLVGKGDMLFNPLGLGKPVRVQGCFVSDEEVHNIIEYVKSQTEDVEYAGDVIETIEKGNVTAGKDDDADELLQEAIECVVSAGQASVSMLQRRFRIGYNRAARIVDEMEARGIVSAQDGARPRQVLLTEDELNEMKENVDE
ncbi:MAG: DNA translocase FtsK [Eubacterium sp.]|nr:DNA translocase FtsK [Eubacterium sp.]